MAVLCAFVWMCVSLCLTGCNDSLYVCCACCDSYTNSHKYLENKVPLFNTHSDDDNDGINKTRLFLNICNDFVTAAAASAAAAVIFCVEEVNKKIHVKLNRKRMLRKQNLSHTCITSHV